MKLKLDGREKSSFKGFDLGIVVVEEDDDDGGDDDDDDVDEDEDEKGADEDEDEPITPTRCPLRRFGRGPGTLDPGREFISD